MARATTTKVVDLDAELAELFSDAAKKVEYKKVKLFGREWRAQTSMNVYTAMAGAEGDAKALVSLLSNVVHPDEREDFRTALMNVDGMDAELLMTILGKLTEVAAERPTKSSAGSSGGQTRVRTKPQSSAAR
jgi:hypothetical protein